MVLFTLIFHVHRRNIVSIIANDGRFVNTVGFSRALLLCSGLHLLFVLILLATAVPPRPRLLLAHSGTIIRVEIAIANILPFIYRDLFTGLIGLIFKTDPWVRISATAAVIPIHRTQAHHIAINFVVCFGGGSAAPGVTVGLTINGQLGDFPLQKLAIVSIVIDNRHQHVPAIGLIFPEATDANPNIFRDIVNHNVKGPDQHVDTALVLFATPPGLVITEAQIVLAVAHTPGGIEQNHDVGDALILRIIRVGAGEEYLRIVRVQRCRREKQQQPKKRRFDYEIMHCHILSPRSLFDVGRRLQRPL